MEDKIKEISLKDLLDTEFTVNDKNEIVGTFTITRINMIADILTNLQTEVDKLTAESTEWESKCYDLQEKIYKAIEYIEEYIKYECDGTFNGMSFYSYHLYDFKKDDLLNILKGDKDE